MGHSRRWAQVVSCEGDFLEVICDGRGLESLGRSKMSPRISGQDLLEISGLNELVACQPGLQQVPITTLVKVS